MDDDPIRPDSESQWETDVESLADQQAGRARSGDGEIADTRAPDERPEIGSTPDTAAPTAPASSPGSTPPQADDPSPEAPTVIRSRSSVSDQEIGDLVKRLPGTELVGTELGHYRLEELVGGGGMGSVFRGTDIELGRPVAVKVISAIANSQDALKRFKIEAQNAARLDHAHIARVYYVGETDDWNYIVFEYVDGENLRERVQRAGPLPIEDVLLYAAQVAEALDHAWERNVVHRDIKPSNIVLQPDGNVKLVDMGLARFHQHDDASDEITASEVILGTFDYISPEQARNSRNVDVRSDLYSLGCTLYFLLTGKPPFPDDNALQKLLSHTGDAPPDPRELRPDLDPSITDLIHRLMAKDPERRFQTPREFTGQLIILSSDLAISLGGRKTRVWVERSAVSMRSWQGHLAWIVPTGLLLLMVALLHWTMASEPVTLRFPTYLAPLVESTDEQDTTDGESADEDLSAAEDRGATTADDNESADAVEARRAEIPADRGPPSGESPGPSGSADTAVDNGSDNSGGDNDRGDNDRGDNDRGDNDTNGSRSPIDSSGGAPNPSGSRGASARDEGSVRDGTGSGGTTDSGTTADNSTTDSALADSTPPSLDPVRPGRVMGESGDPVAGEDESLIVVADERPLDEETGVWRRDLASAVRLANENPNIQRIELRYDGPRVQQPVRLTNQQELTIAAAAGFSPAVLFQPDLDNVLGTKHMVELAGARVTWQGMPIRLTLPELEPAEGWSIFALKGATSLDVTRSTLTIENRDASGIVWHYNVSAFLLLPDDRATLIMPGGDNRPTSPLAQTRPAIRLASSIVRGQANLLRAEEAAAFKLSWTDGLFVSDQLMFDLSGAVDNRKVDGTMEIGLTRVTARAAGGLARVNLARRMHPVPLQLTMNFCIVISEPSIPLVEHRGVGDRSAMARLLRMTGQRNAYPPLWPDANNPPLGDRAAWSVYFGDAESMTISFADDDPAWNDFGPGTVVAWTNARPDELPVHEHRPSDYQVERTDTNPAEQAGFADELLNE